MGILDAYSQAPLGMHASATRPTADAAARLLKRVAAAWGRPRYVAIDGGPEFRGAFRRTVRRLGSQIRLGSPGKTTITGLIERFWRTLDWLMGFPLALPLMLADFEERLAVALNYYTCQRPIYSLAGATPAERLARAQPKAATAVQPPRAKPGVNRGPPPMRAVWLDPSSRRLPFFQPA
jgi:transposase InsO family protein